MDFFKKLLGNKYRDDLSTEELETLVEEEYGKVKTSFDKAASQAAERKRKLEEKMTDEEKRTAEYQETLKTLTEERDRLVRDKNIASMQAKFVSLGQDAETAEASAIALVDGNTDVLFSNLMKATETAKQTALNDALKSTPRPDSVTVTAEKIDYAKKIAEASSNAEKVYWATKQQEELHK